MLNEDKLPAKPFNVPKRHLFDNLTKKSHINLHMCVFFCTFARFLYAIPKQKTDKMRKSMLFMAALALGISAFAQSETLMTINGKDISAEEFLYI